MAVSLANRLKAILAERQLSARALSSRAGLNVDTVGAILAGRSLHPRHDTIEKLAGALGLPATALLGLEAAAAGAVIELPSPRSVRRELDDIDVASIRTIREALIAAGQAPARLIALEQRANRLRAELRKFINEDDP